MADIDNKKEYTDKVIEVGRKGVCTSQDFYYFLPNFPMLRGSENLFYFSKSWILAKNSSVSLIVDAIKGLHLIEMKYREVNHQGEGFGFGSPSRTESLINYLRGINEKKAEELFNWVAQNGGNYYIEPGITFARAMDKVRIRNENYKKNY